MSSYGNQILNVPTPESQFEQSRYNQDTHDIAQQQSQQEAIKTQEINRQWQAQKAYADALKKNVRLVPAPGYTDAPDAVQPIATGTDPGTGRPSLAMDNGATPGLQSASNSLAPTVSSPVAPPIPPTPAAANSLAGAAAGPSAPAMPSAEPSPVPAVSPNQPLGLKPMNPNDPSTYRVIYDNNGINNDLTAAGFGPEAIQNDKARAAALTTVVDQHIKALDETGKRMKVLADALTAVPLTDFNETDPQKLQQQQQNSQFGAIQQLRYAVQNGGIDPSQEAVLEQQIRSGWTPQLQQQVQMLANSATAAHDQHIEALDATREHREQLTANSTNSDRELQSQQRRLANGAQTSVAVHDQPSFDNWYNNLDDASKKDFADVYKRGYSPENLNLIQNMGRTEEQRVRDNEIRAQHDILNSQRQERQSFLEATRLAGRNQDKAQTDRDETALRKLQSDERKAYVERSRLAQELANAKSGKPWLYIQKGGGTKQSSQISDPNDQQAAVSDMQARHDALTDDLEEIINQKYDITKDTGKMSRADALAKVKAEAPDVAGATAPKNTGGDAGGGPLYMAPGKVDGLVKAGNIDLKKLPIINNPDGSYSTVYSTSFEDEKPGSPTYGKEVLVRGIINGKKTDDVNALRNKYYQDGQHLGVFNDGASADAYGQRLHSDWAAGKIPGVQMPPSSLKGNLVNQSPSKPKGDNLKPAPAASYSDLKMLMPDKKTVAVFKNAAERDAFIKKYNLVPVTK